MHPPTAFFCQLCFSCAMFCWCCCCCYFVRIKKYKLFGSVSVECSICTIFAIEGPHKHTLLNDWTTPQTCRLRWLNGRNSWIASALAMLSLHVCFGCYCCCKAFVGLCLVAWFPAISHFPYIRCCVSVCLPPGKHILRVDHIIYNIYVSIYLNMALLRRRRRRPHRIWWMASCAELAKQRYIYIYCAKIPDGTVVVLFVDSFELYSSPKRFEKDIKHVELCVILCALETPPYLGRCVMFFFYIQLLLRAFRVFLRVASVAAAALVSAGALHDPHCSLTLKLIHSVCVLLRCSDIVRARATCACVLVQWAKHTSNMKFPFCMLCRHVNYITYP